MALHDISATSETEWEIDPEDSRIEFSIGKSPLHRVRGRFHGVHGWVVSAADALGNAHAEIEIDAGSIDTHFSVRDWHLRTGQFLNAKRFPTISFVSTHADELGRNTLLVTGDLTIRGITRHVAIDATIVRRDDKSAHITAETSVNVRDFSIGPKAMGLVVGNAVTVQITLTLRNRSNTSS